MPTSTNTAEARGRYATLRLTHGPEGQVLTASAPSDITQEDFSRVGRSALDLIQKLTGCNCLSGRIKVVIEDNFADVIRVDLGRAGGGPGD
jgi:hypothetical protein